MKVKGLKKLLYVTAALILVLSLCTAAASAEETLPAEAPASDAAVLPAEPEFAQVPVSRVSASGYIAGRTAPDTYAPGKMIDGDEGTTWQFSVKENKLGEAYAEFCFDAPVSVDALWIKNGFWKVNKNGHDQYTRNSRVKTMTLLVRYEGGTGYTELVTVTLKDDKSRAGWQTVDMTGLENVTGVQLRVDDIYRGSTYRNDVGITEVMFVRKTR